MAKRILNQDLIADLQQTARRLDKRSLTAQTYDKHGTYTIRPFIRAFGNWNGALYHAKLEITRKGRPRANHRINLRERHLVMKRDHFRCVYCGQSPAKNPKIVLHVDHIVPVAKGGIKAINNLQTLCSDCNLGKSDL